MGSVLHSRGCMYIERGLTPSVSVRVFGKTIDDSVHGLFENGLGPGVGHRTRHRLSSGSAAGGNRRGGLALVPGHVGRHILHTTLSNRRRKPVKGPSRRRRRDESSRRERETSRSSLTRGMQILFETRSGRKTTRTLVGRGGSGPFSFCPMFSDNWFRRATGESCFNGIGGAPEYRLLLSFKVETGLGIYSIKEQNRVFLQFKPVTS